MEKYIYMCIYIYSQRTSQVEKLKIYVNILPSYHGHMLGQDF